MHANPGTDAGALQIGSTVVVPFNFPLVSGEVPYTSLLTGWIIEGLQARYPYLQVGTIGRSVMGTPLWSLQLGNGPVEVGYNASFHANESITTPVLLKFVERLLETYADERMYEELYPERRRTLSKAWPAWAAVWGDPTSIRASRRQKRPEICSSARLTPEKFMQIWTAIPWISFPCTAESVGRGGKTAEAEN